MTLGAFLCLEHASVPRKDQSDYMVEQLLVQIEITMQKDAMRAISLPIPILLLLANYTQSSSTVPGWLREIPVTFGKPRSCPGKSSRDAHQRGPACDISLLSLPTVL